MKDNKQDLLQKTYQQAIQENKEFNNKFKAIKEIIKFQMGIERQLKTQNEIDYWGVIMKIGSIIGKENDIKC